MIEREEFEACLDQMAQRVDYLENEVQTLRWAIDDLEVQLERAKDRISDLEYR